MVSIFYLQLHLAKLRVGARHHRKRRSVGGSCVVRMQTNDRRKGRTGLSLEVVKQSLADMPGALVGATMRLPQGFEGFVLRKPQADANAARTWQTDACISELT
jgi:hypothetical protein